MKRKTNGVTERRIYHDWYRVAHGFRLHVAWCAACGAVSVKRGRKYTYSEVGNRVAVKLGLDENGKQLNWGPCTAQWDTS